MTPPEDPLHAEIRRRQKGRALIMALLLGAFAILIYAITIVRMDPS